MKTEQIIAAAGKHCSGVTSAKEYVFTEDELLWFVNELSTVERLKSAEELDPKMMESKAADLAKKAYPIGHQGYPKFTIGANMRAAYIRGWVERGAEYAITKAAPVVAGCGWVRANERMPDQPKQDLTLLPIKYKGEYKLLIWIDHEFETPGWNFYRGPAVGAHYKVRKGEWQNIEWLEETFLSSIPAPLSLPSVEECILWAQRNFDYLSDKGRETIAQLIEFVQTPKQQ
jgi:hypothetical protein